jgi:hypothetical protein
MAARTMFEGDEVASAAAVQRIVSSDFSDPEGLYYVVRHLARLNQVDSALELFECVVNRGFVCYPAMVNDTWLEPIRHQPAFQSTLRKAEEQHRLAEQEFVRLEGDRILGMATRAGNR